MTEQLYVARHSCYHFKRSDCQTLWSWG